MKIKQQLKAKEKREVEHSFPKLKIMWSKEKQSIILFGELDICDDRGEYWDTYDIEIVLGSGFPNKVPIVIEHSKKIPRVKERHISSNGVCCLDMNHHLLKLANRGINVCQFIRDKVYPYFANQLYYDENKKYAAGEWPHEKDGVWKFYTKELKFCDDATIIFFLKSILNHKLPNRNELCPCNSGEKYKKCFHKDSVDFLQQVGKTQLIGDLEYFESKPV